MVSCGAALASDEEPAVAATLPGQQPMILAREEPPPPPRPILVAPEPETEPAPEARRYEPVQAPAFARTAEEAEEAVRLQVPAWVAEASQRLKVPAALIHALISVESRHRSKARSATGCRGLMQVGGRWRDHRPVVERFGLVDDPNDPRTNIFVGTSILRRMMKAVRRSGFRSRDDWMKAVIASYNVGQRIVLRAARAARRQHGGRLSWAQTYQQISSRLLATEPAYQRGRWHGGEWGPWSLGRKVRNLGYFVRGVHRRYRRISARM